MDDLDLNAKYLNYIAVTKVAMEKGAAAVNTIAAAEAEAEATARAVLASGLLKNASVADVTTLFKDPVKTLKVFRAVAEQLQKQTKEASAAPIGRPANPPIHPAQKYTRANRKPSAADEAWSKAEAELTNRR